MFKKWGYPAVSFIAAAAFLTGCSTQPQEEAAPQQQPITLKIFSGDSQFEQVIKSDKVKMKFPYITFEYVVGGQGKQIQDLVAAGESPDMYYQGLSALINNLVDYNLQYDLKDMIKKTGFDLNRIDKAYLDIIQAASGTYGGTYFGLPVTTFMTVLYYNKDVFDKFGIPYPKDGMTWDQAYELARSLTRVSDGVQYKGMTMNFAYLFDNNQLAAPYFHPKENRSAMSTDPWRSIFRTLGKFYQIPLNKPLTERSRVAEVNDFTKDRVSAMHADVTAAMENFPNDFVNWDMVSLPVMAEAPGINAQLNPRFLYLMSTSKHKEEAFKVIDFLLSNEMQMASSKAGKATVLNNEEVRKAYGQDYARLQGKHTQALYVNKPVGVSPARDSKLINVPTAAPVGKEFNAFINGTKDVNTALRDLDETLNKSISEAKNK
jgi:ABC-type glycerol-3-phosphate transport system substrate-binding protein